MANARPKGAFMKGHNALKTKIGGKPISKEKQKELKKADAAETAAVLSEYIADFEMGAALGKTFLRENTEEEVKPNIIVPVVQAPAQSQVYKPKAAARMAELAEEFQKSKAITEEYQESKLEPLKKKGVDKKKSNLELFKEELQQSQKERDIRHKLQVGDMTGLTDDMLSALPISAFKAQPQDEFAPMSGSYDTGDPTTTNLFVSNLNPKMNEETLCKVFGKYGPLASVKIMWPRTDEEKARNRNCGFVAFMNRIDGEKALADIEGKDVMEFEMKIGWGKAVPIPPVPIYVHPSQAARVVRPPKQSGMPFNCQIPGKMKKAGIPFDGNLEKTVVKVVIPTERPLLALINRMVEFVVREGPMFEAMIMNREISNPMFRFLFDNKSNAHSYYRWRVFSILQGDTPSKWTPGAFVMFKGGSVWEAPVVTQNLGHPSMNLAGMNTSSALACLSSANVHNMIPAGAMTMEKDDPRAVEARDVPVVKPEVMNEVEINGDKKSSSSLTDRQRDHLEDMLRTITTDRAKIGELMVWCIDHASCSAEIVECISESLSILETPIPTKIARLYVLSDILHNSAAKVPYASNYRQGFQDVLMEIVENLHKALASCSTKIKAEKFRKQVLSCLAAWQDWSIYSPNILINFQNVFTGLLTDSATAKDVPEEKEEEMMPLTKDIVEEVEELEDDIDGVPLDPELDGITLEKDTDAALQDSRWASSKKQASSRWDPSAETDHPVDKSRWVKDEEEEQKDSAKWNKVDDEPKKEEPKKEEKPSTTYSVDDGSEDEEGKMDEARRKFLRDVELKVMRFVDKLEQRGSATRSLNITNEAQKFRQQLIDEYDAAKKKATRKKLKAERKRERDDSPQLEDPKPKKHKKAKKSSKASSARVSSASDSDSNDSPVIESPVRKKTASKKKSERSRSSSNDSIVSERRQRRSSSPDTPLSKSTKKRPPDSSPERNSSSDDPAFDTPTRRPRSLSPDSNDSPPQKVKKKKKKNKK